MAAAVPVASIRLASNSIYVSKLLSRKASDEASGQADALAAVRAGGTIEIGSLCVMTTTKPSHKLTFHDRLSRLTFDQARKLLGPEGRQLIQQGAKREVSLEQEVFLGGDLFRVSFPGIGNATEAVAT